MKKQTPAIPQGSPYRHYVSPDITMPQRNMAKILLVGAGGNGTAMLTGLARMNYALRKLRHPGLDITVMDPDSVGPENVGRQLFSPSDVGRNKAVTYATRINNFFGMRVSARPFALEDAHAEQMKKGDMNLIITAVDRVRPRRTAYAMARKAGAYWLDMGNTQKTGQCILGTGASVKQPDNPNWPCMPHLPTMLDLFPDLEKHENADEQGPSCGMEEALSRQDLFINSAVTTYALSLLWDAFRQGYITQHGVFINLETKRTNPLPINPATWKQMGWDPLRKLTDERPRGKDHKRTAKAA